MKLLADENIEAAMIEWLRLQGHDLFWIAEQLPSMPDHEILDLAKFQSRIILTRDLDFGGLIYREKLITTGVILLRLIAKNQYERLSLLKPWWP